MIDPVHMTEYGASIHRLEEIALFSVLVANNNAMSTAMGLDKFLTLMRQLTQSRGKSPLGLIRRCCEIFQDNGKDDIAEMAKMLRDSGIGKFNRKGRAVIELAFSKLNLCTCTPEDLEKIYNIGFKTSRFFILHTRRNAKYAALDVHILHFLKDQGYDVPSQTPGNANLYREIEKQFLAIAQSRRKSVAKLDLEIWNQYSKNGDKRNAKMQRRSKVQGD